MATKDYKVLKMVGWRKFLAIPVLIVLYYFFVNAITSSNFFVSVSPQSLQEPSNGVTIGLGQSVSVSVVRPYLFGLVKLPVYSASLGNIGIYHEAFFYFIIALTAAFILMEKFQKKEGFTFQRRENKMARLNLNWMRLLKAAIFGIVFGLVSFILSGDGGASVALGLLLIYLEYKLK